MTIKFNIYNVTNGEVSARVFYSTTANRGGRQCVTLYAKDYTRNLGKIFAGEYQNDTDTQSDYFDEGHVTLFEDHPLYAAARQRAEANNARNEARWAAKKR
jgi:hypothetical protein